MIRRPVPPEATAALRLAWAVARIARNGAPRNVRAIVDWLLERAEPNYRTIEPAKEFAVEIARVGKHCGVFLPRGRTVLEQRDLLRRILNYFQASTGTRTPVECEAVLAFCKLIDTWEPGEAVN